MVCTSARIRDGRTLHDTLFNPTTARYLLVVEHDEAHDGKHRVNASSIQPKKLNGGRTHSRRYPRAISQSFKSLTGKYLKKGIPHPIRGEYRKPPPRAASQDSWVKLAGVNFRNLKNQSIRFLTERLIMVCGSSGAG